MDTIADQAELTDIILRYADALRGLIRVDALYLYGSYSTGNANTDSDIDLLVVSPDFSEDFIENRLS